MDEQRLLERLDKVALAIQANDARRALLADEAHHLRERLAGLRAVWPQRITLAVSAKEETLWAAGNALGLTDEALQLFEHARAYTLALEVTQEGHVTVIACDTIPLARDRQRSPKE